MNCVTNWISHDHQMKPAHGQKVIYFAPDVGIGRGRYDAMKERFTGESSEYVSGSMTHWRPDHGERVLPDPPEEYSGPGEEDGPWAPGYAERCAP